MQRVDQLFCTAPWKCLFFSFSDCLSKAIRPFNLNTAVAKTGNLLLFPFSALGKKITKLAASGIPEFSPYPFFASPSSAESISPAIPSSQQLRGRLFQAGNDLLPQLRSASSGRSGRNYDRFPISNRQRTRSLPDTGLFQLSDVLLFQSIFELSLLFSDGSIGCKRKSEQLKFEIDLLELPNVRKCRYHSVDVRSEPNDSFNPVPVNFFNDNQNKRLEQFSIHLFDNRIINLQVLKSSQKISQQFCHLISM